MVHRGVAHPPPQRAADHAGQLLQDVREELVVGAVANPANVLRVVFRENVVEDRGASYLPVELVAQPVRNTGKQLSTHTGCATRVTCVLRK